MEACAILLETAGNPRSFVGITDQERFGVVMLYSWKKLSLFSLFFLLILCFSFSFSPPPGFG
jgi:hypothetical protein